MTAHPPQNEAPALSASNAIRRVAFISPLAMLVLGLLLCGYHILRQNAPGAIGRSSAMELATAILFVAYLLGFMLGGQVLQGLFLFLSECCSTLELARTFLVNAPQSNSGSSVQAERTSEQDPRFAELSRAIESFEWARAESLLLELPDAEQRPAQSLEAARLKAAESVRSQLETARSNNDAELVLALHEKLSRHADPASTAALDVELMEWLLRWLQRRLRSGRVDIDLVDLATRAVERFADVPQAASLRAALPTLRRSAGLCARCGQPFIGLADVCPICRAGIRVLDPSGDEKNSNNSAEESDSDLSGRKATGLVDAEEESELPWAFPFEDPVFGKVDGAEDTA